MTLDCGTNVYVPCAYALMTRKSQQLCCNLLHEMVVLLNYYWTPRYVTYDFEQALLNAIKCEFPKSKIINCIFHFKQAIKKRLMKIKRSGEEQSLVLRNIDMLPAIIPSELDMAINFIKSQRGFASAGFDLFWSYFSRAWILEHDPSLWNVGSIEDGSIVGQTNNALERYNRRIAEMLIAGHPSLSCFITILQKEVLCYFTRLENMRKGIDSIAVSYNEWNAPHPTHAYYDFCNRMPQ